MARFKKLSLRPPPFKAGNVAGKGSRQEMLPSRDALATLVGGNPIERSFGYYGKLTPSGFSAPQTYAEIQRLGMKFPKRPSKK